MEETKPLTRFALPVAALIIPVNFGLWYVMVDANSTLAGFAWVALCVAQLVLGIVAAVHHFRRRQFVRGPLSVLVALGAPVGLFVGGAAAAAASIGGAWGRPLRVRGKQLHPELRDGADWTEGAKPSPLGLDEATRRALEALWLHDAQKEHASVPAFSRISWLLAAVGAPADLMAWSHRAALEEIEHTQRCFALAAGYGGRSFTVEPMPDLLLGGLNDVRAPLVTLAVESLQDGCLLEDFNADVAARCAAVCEEPVTRAVLQQIAREERSHADFSWALIGWLVATHGAVVRPALARALEGLEAVRRPTSATEEKQRFVEAADGAALRRHGRLTDAEWAACWKERLVATRARANRILSVKLAA